jgi:tetratricopeptide (TPR) repeat protein
VSAVVLLVAMACGGRSPAVVAPAARDDLAAAWAEAERHFAARADEAELRAALAAAERATVVDPTDVRPWLLLARGRLLLADGFLVFAAEAGDAGAKRERRELLERGAEAAERGLRAASPELARLRDQGAPLTSAIDVLGPDAAPLLYFWAQNRILWAAESGLATTIANFDAVFRVMERAAALDPAVWYGGPDRFFATMFAAAPAVAGGDMDKARRHFEASLALAPAYGETRVLYAALYAKKVGDRELFVRLLEEVLAIPEDALPELAAEQAIARRKARALLKAGG